MQQAGQTDAASVTAPSDQSLSRLIDRVRTIHAKYEISALVPHLEACSLLLHQKDLGCHAVLLMILFSLKDPASVLFAA